ncbi:MAG: T9SS type A sorting domain-containing protein, partial [Bacteroidota bacterium]
SNDGTIADAVYVYDPFSRTYKSFSRAAGDVVAPLQGFLLEIQELPMNGFVTWEIPQSARTSGGAFISKTADRATLVLERRTDDGWERAETLALARGRALDTSKPAIAPDGSPMPTFLTATAARRAGLGQVGVEASGETLALDLRADDGAYRWTLDGALNGMSVAVRDAWSGQTIDLTDAYTFDASGDLEGRFSLVISAEGDDAPEASGVGPVFPNPTAGTARVLVDLPKQQAVRVEVLDLLGRVVAVAYEGDTQTASIAVDTRGLAPGAYLVRVSGESVREVRRLTVTR